MLGHVSLEVPDLAAATEYYGELFDLLDLTPWHRPGKVLAFGPAAGERGTAVFVYEARSPGAPRAAAGAPGIGHLAFTVRARQAVDLVHLVVRGHGRPVEHEPQVFPQYPQPYYATFWEDVSGVRFEAVCHHDR